jgi:heme/copper-type cytochrome/quinol oxidase subunit 2
VPVAVRITSGKVDPPVHRVTVPLGARVDLTVTSDVADAVHVHGYDFEKTLPAGAPATLSFTADQPGLFEVETHETGLQLVQLVVR